MKEPAVYLAYTPRGAGVLCAVFYLALEEDVYGWYTGSRGAEFPCAFFKLENFYSPHETVFYRSEEDDVYGTWLKQTKAGALPIDRPVPVPEEICHELERLQSVFVQEWLFYADQPDNTEEAAAYESQELPVQPVNIKNRKLGKLDKTDAVWTYTSPGVDGNVLGFLMRHWPLDYDAP